MALKVSVVLEFIELLIELVVIHLFRSCWSYSLHVTHFKVWRLFLDVRKLIKLSKNVFEIHVVVDLLKGSFGPVFDSCQVLFYCFAIIRLCLYHHLCFILEVFDILGCACSRPKLLFDQLIVAIKARFVLIKHCIDIWDFFLYVVVEFEYLTVSVRLGCLCVPLNSWICRAICCFDVLLKPTIGKLFIIMNPLLLIRIVHKRSDGIVNYLGHVVPLFGNDLEDCIRPLRHLSVRPWLCGVLRFLETSRFEFWTLWSLIIINRRIIWANPTALSLV